MHREEEFAEALLLRGSSPYVEYRQSCHSVAKVATFLLSEVYKLVFVFFHSLITDVVSSFSTVEWRNNVPEHPFNAAD